MTNETQLDGFNGHPSLQRISSERFAERWQRKWLIQFALNSGALAAILLLGLVPTVVLLLSQGVGIALLWICMWFVFFGMALGHMIPTVVALARNRPCMYVDHSKWEISSKDDKFFISDGKYSCVVERSDITRVKKHWPELSFDLDLPDGVTEVEIKNRHALIIPNKATGILEVLKLDVRENPIRL